MGKNNIKKSNWLAGVILLVIITILVLVELLAFEKELFSLYFIRIVCPLICGILLLFVRIKSYGWAIALSVFLSVLLDTVLQETGDVARIITLSIASVVALGLLIYKNVVKK